MDDWHGTGLTVPDELLPHAEEALRSAVRMQDAEIAYEIGDPVLGDKPHGKLHCYAVYKCRGILCRHAGYWGRRDTMPSTDTLDGAISYLLVSRAKKIIEEMHAEHDKREAEKREQRRLEREAEAARKKKAREERAAAKAEVERQKQARRDERERRKAERDAEAERKQAKKRKAALGVQFSDT